MGVSALAYLAVETAHAEAWHDLLTNVMGLAPSNPAGGATHYRLDAWQQRLTIIPSDRDAIAAVGWQAPNAETLAQLAASLTAADVELHWASAEDCAARGCGKMLRFDDPISTMPTEIMSDPTLAKLPFAPGAAISGYETGDLGLGHVVYFVEDYSGGDLFYREVMGFQTSDRIVWDDGEKDATFYHCNPRHHSLAIMPPFGEIPPGTFNHLMLQARSINDVGIMYDRIRAMKLPIIMNLGKHTNDHTESFYFVTPSGFGLEIGCNSRTITPGWDTKVYDAPMIWGHEAPGTYD